jgi:hypothetical protein
MKKTTPKPDKGQGNETLQRLANDQRAYYEAWAASWARMIAERASVNQGSRQKEKHSVAQGHSIGG